MQLYTGLANDALKVLDASLAKSSFLVGNEATIADVAVYGDVAYAEEGAIDLAPYANVKAWMATGREAARLQEVRRRAAEAGRSLIDGRTGRQAVRPVVTPPFRLPGSPEPSAIARHRR